MINIKTLWKHLHTNRKGMLEFLPAIYAISQFCVTLCPLFRLEYCSIVKLLRVPCHKTHSKQNVTQSCKKKFFSASRTNIQYMLNGIVWKDYSNLNLLTSTECFEFDQWTGMYGKWWIRGEGRKKNRETLYFPFVLYSLQYPLPLGIIRPAGKWSFLGRINRSR